MTEKRDAPTLQEQYACASSTPNLGLPHGEGAGAQGILAAAAWTEVHLGSALWRLAAAWEIAKPRKHVPRPYQLLKTGGLNRDQARQQRHRDLVAYARTYSREIKALKLRIPEYHQILEELMVRAVLFGLEDPDAKAMGVLDRWLENPQQPPKSEPEAKLWQYIAECLNSARAELRQGVQGHTKHEIVDE